MKKLLNRNTIFQIYSKAVVSALIAMVALLGTPLTTFAGAPVRTFTAVITPASVVTNMTQSYSVSVTNTGNGEEINAVRVIFPTGFSNVSNTTTNLSGWGSSLSTTTVTNDTIWFFTGSGNGVPGIPSNGTGTFNFSVKSPSTASSNTIDFRAFKNSSGNPGVGAEFNLSGSSIIIVVGDPAVCADGIDNDNDGKTDFPQDLGCTDANDTDETGPVIVNTAPTITLNGDTSVSIGQGTSYNELGATCTDTEDGNSSATIIGTVDTNTAGTYTLSYSCTDTGGLTSSTITRTVIVTETQAPNNKPAIVLNGNAVVNIDVGTSYVDAGALAKDIEDGDVTVTDITGSVDINTVGIYTLTYNYTDTGGLTADPVTRTVNVNEVVVIPTDVCPNIEGVQTTVPEGKELVDGQCTDIVIVTPPTDVCPNIEGVQTTVPEGKMISGNECVNDTDADTIPDTTDNCPVNANTDQADNDHDNIGNVCDNTPNGDPVNETPVTTGGGGGSRSGSIARVLGASTEGRVLGANACTPYLNTYIKLGAKNDKAEVMKLQTFLNEHMGLDLKVDGNYGLKSYNAVKKFQVKYNEQVLTPWMPFGLAKKDGTGYVYKTTQRWVNLLKCPELNLPTPKLP